VAAEDLRSAQCPGEVGLQDRVPVVRPAQLTMMSTLPKRATDACSSASSDARSVTSEATASEPRPMASISRTVSSTRSARRDVGTTLAPASASARDMMRPIPEVPPMTTAV
jgi:hypothetical protein